eukprot:TRINITY_DN18193_c0_g1_i2.p1 TRINITY_DN18193_c0_g1~~TRINITY_DN18193_c0_g1_i2.p1  ORF type:complete len:505 (+),score=96.84 TRINITY_DN18193_c0_g1_i2:25-1539(+)
MVATAVTATGGAVATMQASTSLSLATQPLLPGSGWTADEVFTSRNGGLRLDDLVFLPGNKLDFSSNLATRLTKQTQLRMPMISGPWEHVTEEDMAISMALLGGIGIIHRHMSVEEQAEKVRKVKAFESGFLLNPTCLARNHTVADALRLQAELGCSAIPITENGRVGGKLVGLVTKRETDGEERTRTLENIMIRDVVFAREPVTLKDSTELMRQAKVAKLPVVNGDGELVALICRGDLKRSLKCPEASRDANRQLQVVAAVSPSEPDGEERAKAIVNAGADVLCLDTEDGVTDHTVAFLRWLKENFVGVDIIAGRVNGCREAEALCEAGADAIRVGAAFGAEATAIFEISRHLRKNYGVPVIADTNLRNSGQILKAFALGAASVCLDELLEGCEEAPGDHIYRDGVRYKLGRSPNGPAPVEMGLAGTAVVRGSARTLVPFLLEKVRRGFQELGLMTIHDVPKALDTGLLLMERQLPLAPAHFAEIPKRYPVLAGSLHCSRGRVS